MSNLPTNTRSTIDPYIAHLVGMCMSHSQEMVADGVWHPAIVKAIDELRGHYELLRAHWEDACKQPDEPVAEPVVYGVIVTSKEAKSGAAGNPVMTAEGERFWATVEPGGWVEASSSRVRDDSPPGDPLVFKTREQAEEFAKRWKGHPWWCVPSGQYEIVPLAVKTTTHARITGYRRLPETKDGKHD
jgi:hypothetical protein